MMNAVETIDALIQENTLLKLKIDKLTLELSRQLEDNVGHVQTIREREKSIQDTVFTNTMLLNAGKLMEERYRVMAENIDEIVFVFDLAETCIYANQKAAELFGHNIMEMVGKSIFDIMAKEFGEKYKNEVFDPVTRENRESTFVDIVRQGLGESYVKNHGYPIHDDNGDVIGVLIIGHNITADKKKAEYISIENSINIITSFSDGLEETIKEIFFKLCQAECIFAGGLYLFTEEKQQLELLYHYNLPDVFIEKVTELGVDTTQFAIVARGIPQYDISDDLSEIARNHLTAIGKKTVSVIPLMNEKQIVGSLNVILNDPDKITSEDKLFMETVAWRIARIIGLYDAQLKLNKTVAELNETISDLKVKQQILIQKSKMESLGELSAGMAHEINQPLVIISLSIENILQKMLLGEKNISNAYLQRKFESILLNVSRIQQIVDNMRIFARDQSSITFEKVNIGELILKTMEMVSVQFRAEGIRIITDKIDGKAHVIGNIFKLEQVLLNLLSNSRYAVNEKFNRNMTPDFQKQIEIKAMQRKTDLHIEVSDNGIGIEKEHLEKLFTPFFTTKREEAGTGLGLPIVYGIVKEMNGDIDVNSKVDEFTIVRIILPAV
ncbi:MAG: ATP-binding protein [Bacteroidales bacterium]|nr:ATP-binding protein [Bacteroidales bacterium]